MEKNKTVKNFLCVSRDFPLQKSREKCPSDGLLVIPSSELSSYLRLLRCRPGQWERGRGSTPHRGNVWSGVGNPDSPPTSLLQAVLRLEPEIHKPDAQKTVGKPKNNNKKDQRRKQLQQCCFYHNEENQFLPLNSKTRYGSFADQKSLSFWI